MSEKFPRPYPKTEVYRETLPHIERWKDFLIDEFFKEPKHLKSLNGLQTVELTEDEKRDVRVFVEYAAKRLATASVTSPMKRDDAEALMLEGLHGYAGEGGSKTMPAFSMASGTMMGHDLVHAMIAYTASEGRSMLPSYSRAETSDEQETAQKPIEEEMMVFLWDSTRDTNFIDSLFTLQDPVMAFEKIIRNDFVSKKQYLLPKYRELVQKAESFKESDPLEYYMRIFEAYFIVEQQDNVESRLKPEVLKIVESIQLERSPTYRKIFKDIFDNYNSRNPDPKFFLHELLQMVKPLTERLRRGEV